MNKKSAILFFSVLFLLSLGVLYVFADLTGMTLTNAGDGFSVSSWITDRPSNVNLTVNATQLTGTGIVNITNITFTLNEANITWDAIVPGVGVAENISGETGGIIDNITYYPDGSAWNQWTCLNVTDAAGQIECYIADTDNGLGGVIGNESLILTLNMTASAVVREEVTNFSVKLSNYTVTNETEVNLYIDTKNPRLIEVNISDGNTTYHNSTWGTTYFVNGPLYIEALIEDSQLGNTVVLGYNCNTTNATFATVGGGGYATEEVRTVTQQSVGTIDQRGYITSSRIDCSSWNIEGANETFNFAFLVNDTLNHEIVLNGTDGAVQDGSFRMGLDDGEILPVIAKINVTQTTITGTDGVTTVSKTLNHGLELDGTSDYLAANTVTFDVELTGGNKPNEVWIVWNDSEPSTVRLTPVIGGAWDVAGVDLSAILNASSVSHDPTVVDISNSSDNATTVVYSTTLSLSGNNTNNFVFWVYANNTENNYTRLSGPHKFTVDGAGASVTMTPPTDRTITPRASITYKCTMSDGASGNNKIMWQLKKPGETAFTTKQNYEGIASDGSDSITFTEDNTNLAGDYDVRCIAIDNIGNEQIYTSSSSETFSVHYSTTEVGVAEGAGAAADIDLSTQEEMTITEKQGVISTFTLDGTTIHTIKIKTVDEVAGTVTIVIESDPIEITLKTGETKEVDVDADGINDLSVTLNKITDGAADITTKRLIPLPEKEVPTEEMPPTEKPTEEIPTAEAASKTWLWILIIVIIVVIGVGYWFMKRK